MIYYKKRRRYKYNLQADFEYKTDFKLEAIYDNGFIQLDLDGLLVIKNGYAWDGPSGPTIDTKNFMKGSLVHDALYQLMREGVLPLTDRKRADEMLCEICLSVGMSRIRAWYVYWAVRMFGKSSAIPDLQSAP